MPIFNSESTAQLAINSCLRAMPRDSELRVYDDASTDNTRNVLSRIDDSRVKTVFLPQNIGNGAVRRNILEDSDSEFIASMDADDITMPWRFRYQLSFMEDQSKDACFTTTIRFGQRRIPRPSIPLSLNDNESPIALLYFNPFTQPTAVLRRSAVDAVGGYRSLRRAQDYDLWLRLASAGHSLTRLPLQTLGYRLSATQVSQGALFAESVANDPHLQHAYFELASQLGVNLSSSSGMKEFLQSRLGRFRPANRSYYSRKLDQGSYWSQTYGQL
ncbi:glycosyltransferase family 2 protein [Timonella senegalensis]|uniref:glycosyltransferase family 2 protein n=1 Tax=Timonella senegalensis TaxID=1465825 RepID=UPI0035E445EE